jgi:hypothetical protein
MRQPDVERVAETHFMLRPILIGALKQVSITEEGQRHLGPYSNWYEFWERSYSQRFFDMASLNRLGTALEVGLRDFHFAKTGTHPKDQRVFQRLVDPTKLLALIATDCGGYQLRTNPEWQSMRELMVYRHLYAHRSGAVDAKFMEDFKVVTGDDLTPELAKHGYPAQDVYWFKPLDRLGELIEAARRFFRELP